MEKAKKSLTFSSFILALSPNNTNTKNISVSTKDLYTQDIHYLKSLLSFFLLSEDDKIEFKGKSLN